MTHNTKRAQTRSEIAASFENCLKTKPLNKITIIDITDAGGVSRQMFYHYFSDRTELIRWVCRRYIEKPIYAEDSFCWSKAMQRLAASRNENIVQYQNILHSRYVKLLEDVLYDELYVLYYCICRYRICRTLPNELAEALRAYCVVSSKIILDWFNSTGEDELTPEDIVFKLQDAMPSQFRILLTEHSVSVRDIFRERELLNWAYDDNQR